MLFPGQNRALCTIAKVLIWVFTVQAQPQKSGSLWYPADSLSTKRLVAAGSTGLALYGAASAGLYYAWYRNYELVGFHTFNDWGHWEHMDKWGHAFTNYTYSYLAFGAARWTGMKRSSALWTAAGISMLLQSTIEVMDGFSGGWGFSWPDMAFNAAGTALFVGQELWWREQRIRMKVSNRFPAYDSSPLPATSGAGSTSLAERAGELYGSSLPERFLKDYNGMTIWFSLNPGSFRQNRPLLPWLNIAFGLGAHNLYGARTNSWTGAAGERYDLQRTHPRYRQFYLSLDVDLSRISTRSGFLRFLLGALNWIKIPAPALAYDSRGQWTFHPIYW